MSRGILAPFWVSIGLVSAILLVIPFLSEKNSILSSRVGYRPIPNNPNEDREEPQDDHDEGEGVNSEEEEDTPLNSGSDPQNCCFQRLVTNQIHRFKARVASIWQLARGPSTRFCLAAFFVKRIAFSSENFMFQYSSERFDWPLRETTWLRVAAESGAVLVTMIIGPLLSYILVGKRGVPTQKLDLNVIRVSLILLASSFFAAWQATSAVMLSIGANQTPPFAKS